MITETVCGNDAGRPETMLGSPETMLRLSLSRKGSSEKTTHLARIGALHLCNGICMEIFDVFLLFLAEPVPWASSKCPKEGSHRVSARSAKNSRGYKRSRMECNSWVTQPRTKYGSHEAGIAFGSGFMYEQCVTYLEVTLFFYGCGSVSPC